MASNGDVTAAASLLDAAVRAAITSGAPRRTVAATAAAVASAAMAALRFSSDETLVATVGPAPGQKKKRRRKKKSAGKTNSSAAGEAEPSAMDSFLVPVGKEQDHSEGVAPSGTAVASDGGLRPQPALAKRPFEKDHASAASPPRNRACEFKDVTVGFLSPESRSAFSPENLRAHEAMMSQRLPPVPLFPSDSEQLGVTTAVNFDIASVHSGAC